MAEKPTTPKTVILPDIPALEKDRKEVIAKTRAAEKTIETKTRLVKERQEKIASIQLRLENPEVAPYPKHTLSPEYFSVIKRQKEINQTNQGRPDYHQDKDSGGSVTKGKIGLD